MKLSLMFLIVGMMQVSASVYSQNGKINVNENEIELADLFWKLQETSDLVFIYKSADLAGFNKVSVNLQNASIEEVLTQVLKDKNLEYTIDEDVVIIKRKPVVNDPPVKQKQEKKTITGKVTDENGVSLPGVSVIIKGTNTGVATDIDGNYSLDIEHENTVLIFSFVGMQPQEITYSGQLTQDITLYNDTETMEEVVVTGYQVIAKEKVTGSVVTIQEDDLDKKSTLSIMDNIEGKVPGLVNYRGVTSIRGVSTMNAEADPLIVLDGLPIEGDIEDVNPYDVESITVLKDAAAAAIYGARASNGVIVITTKRAKEKGKTTVEFSTDFTIKEKPDYSYYNYMTPTQQVNWESNYYSWYFSDESTDNNPIATFENKLSSGGKTINKIEYNYYQLAKGEISITELETLLESYKQNNFPEEYKDQVLLNQFIRQYNLAVRTNGEKSQTNLVINYKTDNSGIINAYNRQLNIFLKGKYNVSKWLDVDYGINIISGKEKSHNSSYATDPFNVPTYYSLTDDDGNREYYRVNSNEYFTTTETDQNLYSLAFNHLDELERDFVNTSTLNTRYFVNLNFKIIPGLTFNPMFQYEDNREDISTYSEEDSYTMRYLQDSYAQESGDTYELLLPRGGRLATSQSKSPNYTVRAQVNYNKEFKKHVVDFLAGTEFRETRTHGTKGALYGYDDMLQTEMTTTVDYTSLYYLDSSPMGFYPNYTSNFDDLYDLILDTKHRYASAYANATYTYDQKYNLFGSIRKDYADLFGGDKKYRGRPLWSVGASWVASNEDFMKDFKFLNYLKVRASYGLTGNIDPTTPAVLTAVSSTNPITQLPTANVTNPPNAQLRWEKTATTNIGLDFALFDSRLRGSFDWYHRKGTDLFANKRLDPSEGYENLVINNASMLNKGIEISLNYNWVRPANRDDFSWSSSLVLSHNKNKITYVDNVVTSAFTLPSGDGFKEGYPTRSIFSFQFAGIDEDGLPMWYDGNGEATSSQLSSNDLDAVVFSGGTDPKLSMSLINEFRYKGFSLSIFAVYYGGHFVRTPSVPSSIEYPPYGPVPSYVLDAWTPENIDTYVPGSGQYYQFSLAGATQYQYSDFLVKPADFIKIRNIVFGYNLPANIAKKIKASSIKVRFQINDPGILWKKANNVHFDPENVDGLPTPTSYVLGLNINF